jgi:hypothetical protein
MWYLDNDASYHIYGDIDKFRELDESITGNVTFTDHSKVFIKEKGTILIKLKNKSHQFISDIYYIPNLKKKYIEFETIIGEGL